MQPFSLNIRGRLHTYTRPVVMGVINATPDSFHAPSRLQDADAVKRRVEAMADEGADMIDVGAYSSRPGCGDVSADEELRRLEPVLEALRAAAPDIPVSVDTFRADVAREAVTSMGADMVNDISGGRLDQRMWDTVADLQVPYVLMHMRGTPQTMQSHTVYDDVLAEVAADLARGVTELRLRGLNDIIIDPGFGFSKTLEQNYRILSHLRLFTTLGTPLLVGVSRKQMVTSLLGVPAGEALNGTTAVNMIALERGASILRVHDVAPAVQAVRIHCMALDDGGNVANM